MEGTRYCIQRNDVAWLAVPQSSDSAEESVHGIEISEYCPDCLLLSAIGP